MSGSQTGTRSVCSLAFAFAALGGTAAVIPSVIPAFAADLEVPSTALLPAIPALFTGLLVGVLSTSFASALFSLMTLLRAGAAAQALGLAVAACAPAPLWFVVGAALAGFGFGIVEAAGTAAVRVIGADGLPRALTKLTLIISIVATVTPLAVLAAAMLGWARPIPLLIAVLQLGVVASLRGIPSVPRRTPADGATKTSDTAAAGVAATVTRPGRSARTVQLAFLAAALFCYVGTESVISGWSASTFEHNLGASAAVAALGTSVFWLLMSLGRMSGVAVTDRVLPGRVALGCTALIALALCGGGSAAGTVSCHRSLRPGTRGIRLGVVLRTPHRYRGRTHAGAERRARLLGIRRARRGRGSDDPVHRSVGHVAVWSGRGHDHGGHFSRGIVRALRRFVGLAGDACRKGARCRGSRWDGYYRRLRRRHLLRDIRRALDRGRTMSSRVARLIVHTVDVPLVRPFVTAIRRADAIQAVLVEAVDSDGRSGWGEAAASWRVTGESPASIAAAAAGPLSAAVQGRTLEQPAALSAELAGSILHNTAARAGVDSALYDLAAQQADLPLSEFLGGATAPVVTDMTLSAAGIDELVERASAHVAAGFGTLKIKVGAGQNDHEALLAIRAAVGPAIALRVDANQGWSPEQAVDIIRGWEDAGLGLEFVEQPVAARALTDLVFVTSRVDTPVLADESVWTTSDLVEILSRGAADLINIKLAKTAGFTEAIRLAALAGDNGVGVLVGCMMESQVGITAAAAFVSMLSLADRQRAQDLDAGLWLRSSPVRGGASYRGDMVLPGSGSGFGLGINGLTGPTKTESGR
ncbi:enolase C-terminal domain-like protein [Cryobacterium sp. Y11]|uniref:enolase C-terminal domain-like protein n=1 Tax=Cryobacterium sp. Y11 TaxID=2045016 RepID=UPI0018EAF33C|nr:enolase C-terminal domain-like protein [Cryobacterium sp. Y11]